jgi:hypothetical protein
MKKAKLISHSYQSTLSGETIGTGEEVPAD